MIKIRNAKLLKIQVIICQLNFRLYHVLTITIIIATSFKINRSNFKSRGKINVIVSLYQSQAIFIKLVHKYLQEMPNNVTPNVN